jgi:V-type H+-transporting ATPase subunit H
VLVDNDLLKVCETLLKGNIKEKEVIDDITSMGEIMEKNIKILT